MRNKKRLNNIINQRLRHSTLLNEKYEAEKLIQDQKEIIQKKTTQICTIQRHLLNKLETMMFVLLMALQTCLTNYGGIWRISLMKLIIIL